MKDFDPEKVYNIDLKMKYRLDDLFHYFDKSYIESDTWGMYKALNIVYMRIESLLDNKKDIQEVIKKIDNIAQKKRLSDPDKIEINKLLVRWNMLLHRGGIQNKMWFKRKLTPGEEIDKKEENQYSNEVIEYDSPPELDKIQDSSEN